MRLRFFNYIIILLLNYNGVYGQPEEINIPLQKSDDASVYYFNTIFPRSLSIDVQLPDNSVVAFTLSRYIELKSLNRNLLVYLANNANGSRIIIFDRNFNNDFRDDKVIYFYDSLNSVNEGNYKSEKIKISSSDSIVFDYTIIKSKRLSIDYKDQHENQFFLAVRPHEYKKGVFKIGEINQEFILLSKGLGSFDKSTSYLVLLDTLNNESIQQNAKSGFRFKVGDRIMIKNHAVLFKSISQNGESVNIALINESEIEGNMVGFKGNSFVKNSISHDSVDFSKLRGKYVLLDFWGTWCVPCKQILPNLKILNKKYSNIEMIGVAFDDKIDDVKNYVTRDSILWKQIYEYRKIKDLTNSVVHL